MSICKELEFLVLKKSDNVFTKKLVCGIPKSPMNKAFLGFEN